MGWQNVFPVQSSGGGSSGGDHNDLSNIQGGNATQRYHLTLQQLTDLLVVLNNGIGLPQVTNVTIDFGDENTEARTTVLEADASTSFIYHVISANEDLSLQNVHFYIDNIVHNTSFDVVGVTNEGASGQYIVQVFRMGANYVN